MSQHHGHVVYESAQFRAGARAPAVGKIEYKKGTGQGIISQALSYLSWLSSSRHEFHALVKEKLGEEVAEEIDWRQPRVVCIASDFYRHDRIAVHALQQRIDLIRYRAFEGGVLSLQLVESASGFAPASAGRPESSRSDAVTECGSGPRTVQERLDAAPGSLRALYDELDEMLTASGEVETETKLHYIAYRRLVNVACVLFRPAHHTIVVYLKVDPDTVVLEDGFTRDVRSKGHLGTGDLEVRIRSTTDLERAAPLIHRAFEAA